MSGRFSQRIGVTSVRNVVQIESVDVPLRNRLWNIIYHCLDSSSDLMDYSPQGGLYRSIYLDFFELAIDRIPDLTGMANEEIRVYHFAAEWYKPYDLLEFVLNNVDDPSGSLFEVANDALTNYLSGYRFVNKRLVPITDESHIQVIEDALESPLSGVRSHISKSLSLLSNRDNPDAENSIKEAVLAVESICGSIVGRKDTLGAALKKLEDAGIDIHPALKESWIKLYGYTSDANGIRHALQFDSGATIDDALYFLVSCSAFIGLLTTKSMQAGISLQPVA